MSIVYSTVQYSINIRQSETRWRTFNIGTTASYSSRTRRNWSQQYMLRAVDTPLSYFSTGARTYNNNKMISKTMFMVLSSWQSHCESSPGSFDECRTAPNGRRPKTKPDDLGCESACTGCQNLHPPLPFIIITQPESWYSFYVPQRVEGCRPSWLVTYQDGLPVHRRSPILVLTGSDVVQLRWSRPTHYH